MRKNIEIRKESVKHYKAGYKGEYWFKLFVDGKCKLVASTVKACLDCIYDMGVEDQYNHGKD